MARVLKAYLVLAGTEVAGLKLAREGRDAAAAASTNARERQHIAAIDAWAELVEAWAPLAADGFYAFNDFHALMAFIGAERWDLADETLSTMTRRISSPATRP